MAGRQNPHSGYVVQPSDPPFSFHATTYENMLAIQDGKRGGIVAGGNKPQKREHVFLTAVSNVRTRGLPRIENMPPMEKIILAGKTQYINEPYKTNNFEKPYQVCVNQRDAIQSGKKVFIQTASLAITAYRDVPFKFIVYTQCNDKGTLFYSCAHGNRLEILRQVPAPLNYWMHGDFFLVWYAATYPSAVAIIEKSDNN